MGFRLQILFSTAALTVATPFLAYAGKYGFADKPGGGKSDPIIEVAASVAPNQGAKVSLTPDQANAAYGFVLTTPAPPAGNYTVTSTPPVVPQDAAGANQFISIRFPFKISSSKVAKTIMKNKASLASTSFLTPNVTITDENGFHVPGIATIKGKDVFGTKRSNDPDFPTWLAANGKNLLVDNNVFAYIADDQGADLSMTPRAAFGGTQATPGISTIQEVRIRIDEVDGVIINGYWVVKIGDANGAPLSTAAPTLDEVVALSPVSPPKLQNGNPVVETFSQYSLRFSEPMVPWSIGFSAKTVKDFNASGAAELALIYNANTGVVPNPLDLGNPFFPNLRLSANPSGNTTFSVPFDVQPSNPNNLSEYEVNPIIDLPGNVPVNVLPFAASLNGNVAPTGAAITSAPTNLYGQLFDTQGQAFTFHTAKGRGFVNAPVAPGVIYFVPETGTGIGAINLDGNGLETNDPSVEKLVILTSNLVMCACGVIFDPNTGLPTLAGSHLLGCNGNTFGDFNGQSPIGIAGNFAGSPFGPPTPLPGINEGSVGTTANGGNPLGIFPPGFETLVKDSTGNPLLIRAPDVGGITDVQIGDFLDQLFFDTLSTLVPQGLHLSSVGFNINRNSVSDPPVPNPPPLRLPVGLPPVDIVFNQQKLLKPAFVIEGDEVWPTVAAIGCPTVSMMGTFPDQTRVLLLPNPVSPTLGDLFPAFPQNGPLWQTFAAVAATYGARQQIGNFLYLADRDHGGVTVVNSNSFSVLDRIDVPDPDSMAMAPDLRTLYVTNFGNDTVSVVDTDPFSGTFHKEINRISVGSGPRAIVVQPDNEDVLVGNWIGNSVSIIDVASQTIRNTIIGPFSKPFDLIATPRQTLTGFLSAVYFGYIGSEGTGDVVIYESGPSGVSGFGADAVRWAVNSTTRFEDMRGMAYDQGNYPGGTSNLPGGVFLTHRDEQTGQAMVSRIVFTSQLPFPGALPPVALPGSILNSPGVVQRIFSVVSFWGGPLVPFNQQLNTNGQDQSPRDIGFADMTMSAFHSRGAPTIGFKTNIGSFPGTPSPAAGTTNSKHPYRLSNGAVIPTYVVDRLYVSFTGDNRVTVLDANAGGAILNTILNVPAVGVFSNYFDQ